MVHLMEQHPDVPFTGLEFDNGGDGVPMLDSKRSCSRPNISTFIKISKHANDK